MQDLWIVWEIIGGQPFQNLVALAGVFVAFLGLVLLAITIWYTGDMLHAAQQQTEASFRPALMFGSRSMYPEPGARLEVVNVGTGPALRVVFDVEPMVGNFDRFRSVIRQGDTAQLFSNGGGEPRWGDMPFRNIKVLRCTYSSLSDARYISTFSYTQPTEDSDWTIHTEVEQVAPPQLGRKR